MNIFKAPITRLSLYGALGLVIVLALFAFAARDNLFRFLNDPRTPFQTYTPPPAPDYASPQGWAMAPTRSANTPQIFVVTPSVYWGGKQWNTPPLAPKPLRRLHREAIPNWAGPFFGAGDVAIPLYRSASLFSFLTVRNDARGARELAYQDVSNAFDVFLAQTDDKAPIVLVGVEQGGLHVLGLLRDRFNDPYLLERLAAAYAIDFAVPLDVFGTLLPGIAPCETLGDSRCVITYGAFHPKEKSEIKRFKERTMVWEQSGKLSLTKNRDLACVNPMLGDMSGELAAKALHQGGVAATGLEWGSNPAPLPAQIASQCVDGVLHIGRPSSPALRKQRSFGNRFKPDPFNLFYGDLARDVKMRISNLQTRFATEGRLAPPFENTLELIDSPIQKVPED